jgi:hypothetical protein
VAVAVVAVVVVGTVGANALLVQTTTGTPSPSLIVARTIAPGLKLS